MIDSPAGIPLRGTGNAGTTLLTEIPTDVALRGITFTDKELLVLELNFK